MSYVFCYLQHKDLQLARAGGDPLETVPQFLQLPEAQRQSYFQQVSRIVIPASYANVKLLVWCYQHCLEKRDGSKVQLLPPNYASEHLLISARRAAGVLNVEGTTEGPRDMTRLDLLTCAMYLRGKGSEQAQAMLPIWDDLRKEHPALRFLYFFNENLRRTDAERIVTAIMHPAWYPEENREWLLGKTFQLTSRKIEGLCDVFSGPKDRRYNQYMSRLSVQRYRAILNAMYRHPKWLQDREEIRRSAAKSIPHARLWSRGYQWPQSEVLREEMQTWLMLLVSYWQAHNQRCLHDWILGSYLPQTPLADSGQLDHRVRQQLTTTYG